MHLVRALRLRSLIVSAFLAGTAALSAATYYVSPSGNDSNSGTSTSAPWATVAKVNATALAAGDTVYFQRGGVWRETLAPSASGSSNSLRITFGAYGSGDKPVISGANVITSSWSATSGATAGTYQTALATQPKMVVSNGSAYIKKGPSATTLAANQYFWSAGVLHVNLGGGAPSSGQIEAGQRNHAVSGGGKDYITLENLRLEKTNVSNLVLNNNSTDWIVRDCELYFGNSTSSFAGAGIHADSAHRSVFTGLHINYALGDGVFVYRADDVEVSDSLVENVLDDGGEPGADGIQFSAGSTSTSDRPRILRNTVIRPNNTVQKGCIQQERGSDGLIAYNTCVSGRFGIESNGDRNVVEYNYVSAFGNNGGIRVADNVVMDGGVIRYNVVRSGGFPGITINNESGAVTARTNFKIHNNTLYNTFYGISISVPFSGQIRNNIAWNDGSSNPKQRISINSVASGGSIVCNNNIWHDKGSESLGIFNGVAYASLAAWQSGTGFDANSTSANPLFVSPASPTFDLHLQAGSPAIDAGHAYSGLTDFDGYAIVGANDIGAYEYVDAGLLAYEGFTPAAGTALDGLGSAADGWAGPWSTATTWSTVASGSYSHAGVATTGNRVTFRGTATRALAQTHGGDSGSRWVGFFGFNQSSSRTVQIRLKSGATSVVTIGQSGSGSWTLNGTSTGVGTYNTVAYLLLKIEMGSSGETLKLWVNPDLSSGETSLGTPQATVAAANFTFDGVELHYSSTSYNYGAFDEFALGKTLADVTGGP